MYGSMTFFLFTTAETKTGVLLVEQFKTLINYKILATWDHLRVAFFLDCRVSRNFEFRSI